MQIEITKGEIKSLIYNIINLISISSKNDFPEHFSSEYSSNSIDTLIEKAEFSTFDYNLYV